uniref:Uncharacterized protein n=1 Tax=Peronospora matthiolae TaxID=2874970 RepID=A0AAV1UMB8_9STRA
MQVEQDVASAGLGKYNHVDEYMLQSQWTLLDAHVMRKRSGVIMCSSVIVSYTSYVKFDMGRTSLLQKSCREDTLSLECQVKARTSKSDDALLWLDTKRFGRQMFRRQSGAFTDESTACSTAAMVKDPWFTSIFDKDSSFL